MSTTVVDFECGSSGLREGEYPVPAATETSVLLSFHLPWDSIRGRAFADVCCATCCPAQIHHPRYFISDWKTIGTNAESPSQFACVPKHREEHDGKIGPLLGPSASPLSRCCSFSFLFLTILSSVKFNSRDLLGYNLLILYLEINEMMTVKFILKKYRRQSELFK